MSRCLRPDRTLKPLFAAGLMGAVVALSLLWTQAGVHVSGVFSLMCPPPAVAVQGADGLACSTRGADAGNGWIVWMVCGIFGGALLTAFWRMHGLRLVIERGNGVRQHTRLILAASGGAMVGVGSALAGGCTSSIGLTGSALFSVAAFAFLGVFFLGGFVARLFFGRFWHV